MSSYINGESNTSFLGVILESRKAIKKKHFVIKKDPH